MTDEENRMWNRTDGPVRPKSGVGPGVGIPGSRGGLVGRGGSVDRGRGRARGSYHYSRGLSYEENDTVNGYNPRRNYDRTQSERGGWNERNGGDPGDYVSSSPRKEFSSRSLTDTNWRRHRGGGEEDDTWRGSRTDKWGGRGSSNSWRESENWDRSNNSHPPPRKPWENEENNLPEWATENPSERGGSFDASGAFHGGSTYSDEEEVQGGEGQSRSELSKASRNQPRPVPHSKKEPPNITNGTAPTLTSTHNHAPDTGTSNSAPLRQSQSANNLVSERRTTNHHPITTSASFSGVEKHTPHTLNDSKPTREEPPRKSAPSPPIPQPHPHPPSLQQNKPQPAPAPAPDTKTVRTSQEEEIEQRLLDAADVFVSRLMEDEEKEPAPNTSAPPPSHGPHGPAVSHAHPGDRRWFYQDPQGNVQGPFLPSEMAEWFNSGYFKGGLLVRRACDERYSPLQELCELWNGVPFSLDYYQVPPIKNNDPVVPPVLGNESLLLQYHLQQQQLLLRRQAALAARLGQSDLTFEQAQLYRQADMGLIAQQAGLLGSPDHPPPTSEHVLTVLQHLAQQQAQLQHQRAAAQAQVQVPPPGPPSEPILDPLQQLMQQLGLQTRPPPRSAAPTSPPEGERSIDQFMNAFRQHQTNPNLGAQIETVWGGATTAPSFPGWSAPPGHPPLNPWAEPVAKGIKTEQEVLEEQLRAEEKKKEELRKLEELKRLREEEERQRRIKEEEELERKRKEEEERERKRKHEEEERKRKEAAAKKAEQDRLRKEEEKKKKEEEKRRKEEERRKQDEEKKQVEEAMKRAEEAKKKSEEERKKREEMAKKQNEALKILQEQQQAARVVKPSPAPWTTPEMPGPSLADIQKTERKQQQQMREQTERLKAYQEKHQQEQQQQLKSSKSSASLNLKWADIPVMSQPARVKSLAEIQAEEQERMAKLAEKEKAERIAAAKEVAVPTPGSIWASQSLTWAAPPPWGNSVVGSSQQQRFWDEVSNVKPVVKPSKPANVAVSQSQAKSQAKTKAKKEEASVMKLFEKQFRKSSKSDEFITWCTTTLAGKPVDIPTFVEFLLSIETHKEVREYTSLYLGETKDAYDFASGFFERRSRLQLADQPVRAEPPPPTHSNHFQEVKGKNKKKSKMTKVDSRILGFNVTAAPDRINVGDRDFE